MVEFGGGLFTAGVIRLGKKFSNGWLAQMFGIEGLQVAHVVQIGYVLFGLLVSYWHIERNEMKESLRTARMGFHHVGNLAWYLLALIWPVLLFAYLVEPKSKRKQRGDD